ncbi:MAG: VWA domain-containing protein [Acidobacteriota bacterium]
MAVSKTALNTSKLQESLENLRHKDKLNILDNHLNQTQQIMKWGEVANGEETQISLTKLQMELSDYDDFLELVYGKEPSLFPKVQRLKDEFTTEPSILTAESRINSQLQASCDQIKDRLNNLSGAQLLSYIDRFRYYIAKAEKKIEDLIEWAMALRTMQEVKNLRQGLSDRTTNNYPELTAQTQLLFDQLSDQFKIPWSYGKGRQTHFIAIKLNDLARRLVKLDLEIKNLAKESRQLLAEIEQQAPSEAIADLVAAHSALVAVSSPRLKALKQEILERQQQIKIDLRLAEVEERLLSQVASIPTQTLSTSWLEKLQGGLEPVELLQKTAQSIKAVCQPLPQILETATFQQRERARALKQSLIKHMIASAMQMDETVEGIIAKLSRFGQRLKSIDHSAHICSVPACGGAFLDDDDVLLCPKCRCLQHRDCLINNKCAVCVIFYREDELDEPVKVDILPSRLPIYLLLDCSYYMQGAPFESMKMGYRLIIEGLYDDPHTRAIASVSVIAFSGNEQKILPLTRVSESAVSNFIEELKPSGYAKLNRAIGFLKKVIEEDISAASSAAINSYKPLVFILSSGDWRRNVPSLKGYALASVIAIGCGTIVQQTNLLKVAGRLLLMQDVTPKLIKQYFKLEELPQKPLAVEYLRV